MYQLKLDNMSLIVLEFHVNSIAMILAKVVAVHLIVHHIDRKLLQAMEIVLLHDSQIFDEEITRA